MTPRFGLALGLASLGLCTLLACGEDDAPAQPGITAAGAAGASAGGSAAGGAAGTTSGAGAGGASAGAAGSPDVEPGVGKTVTIGGDRPAKLYVPGSYNPDNAIPLVILLHGYGASGALQELYLNLKKQADLQGFAYANPDGTTDTSGKKFWNATKACCDYGNTGVDDEGYLMGLVDEIAGSVNIDPKRIHFFGHSNGGFMAYRMACKHADRIASVGVLAGGMTIHPEDCTPSNAVGILHVHGDADETIAYGGGSVAVGIEAHPGAEGSILPWRTTNACKGAEASTKKADFDVKLAGEDTTEASYTDCDAGIDLWTIEGGKHIPDFNASFSPAAMQWLLANPKK